jgi:two-component system, NtrC family, nitrogen regulation sensor histidine kinase NtrY
MTMWNRTSRNVSPALWGFFVCIALAGAVSILRIFIPSSIAYHWDEGRTTRQLQNEQVIRRVFQEHVDELTEIIRIASADTSLLIGNKPNDVSESIKAFHALDSYRLQDDQTLELADSLGTLLAWNGPSVTRQYADLLGQDPSERFIRVTQDGLRTYLTVARRFAFGHFYLIASEPLELNSPISNRFIQKTSLSEELSRKLKTKVTLRTLHSGKTSPGGTIVPIVDENGKLVTEFAVEEKTLETAISSIAEVCSMWITACIALGSIFLAYAGSKRIKYARHGWIATLVCILSLWFVRTVWREMEFPAVLMSGWLFSPNVYASPFIFGLSSSLGELIISIVILAISAWLLFAQTVFHDQTDEIIARIAARIHRIGTIVMILLAGVFILWICRGFSEALRSFVFDSTIHFHNPSEIMLDGTAAIMFLNILLLGASVICISTSLIWSARNLFLYQFPSSELKTRILFVMILLINIPLFALVDESPLSLIVGSIFLMTLSILFAEFLLKWNRTGIDIPSMRWRSAVWIMVGSFLLGTPIVHQKLEESERRQVEAVGKELLRPSDSWLNYMVLDGLRVSVESLRSELILNDLADAKKTNLAFVLWTKTLLGKEGHNSAIVLYDQKGNEADRFVVGMSKQDQQEILARVFEGEEDAVHVIGRTGRTALGKLYGAWMTIHDSRGQFAGNLALLLAENQRTLFNEQETEPLRQFGDRFENDLVREIAVQEYSSDTLEFSTGIKLLPDRILPFALKQELQKQENGVLWKNRTTNGFETKTVFMRDLASPERMVSISLEKLDIRWEMFSYLKEFFICLGLLAAFGLYVFIQKSLRGGFPSIGFKGKLFFGFACIAFLPLAVLSYYNRQLVEERVQGQLETTLHRELAQLQDRINTYVTDEEDFVLGVDDDFCEALSDEYGVDFSVYRHASIQSSSRTELYRAGLLDGRLDGNVYSETVLGGKSYFMTRERIGSVEYVVGYAPISLAGSVVGVLAIPTLNREKEIESELAQRNAYVFGVYAIVFGFTIAAGGFLALRFARPIRQLTFAAKDVSEGNLDVHVETHSRDEIGTLARSFNDMVFKLRASREELAIHERENAWKEMAKQVAHEIRNPLTPMKLSVQHVRQAFKDKAPDREEILQRVTQTVIDQIEALSRIAAEFSSFAKMPESKFEKIDVNDLLKETSILFREVQGIKFVDRFAPSMIMVIADRDQLRGVFINIIRNAVQALKKGGTIILETSFERHICLIRISDTGPGIPEQIRAKIFEPNFSTKTEGMGLGLAIARRVVEDHGGSITCSSEQGKGTTFEIRLPV